MDKDIIIDYGSLHSTTAKMAGVSTAGNSIMRSNFQHEDVLTGRGAAEDYAVFFTRRGLKVLELNKHRDGAL